MNYEIEDLVALGYVIVGYALYVFTIIIVLF